MISKLPIVVLPYRGIMPKIHPTSFIAPGVIIIGDVEIGADTNIWFGCVIRADVNIVRIGARTNVQDGTIIHVTAGLKGTHIGNDVTIGHCSLIHDCEIGNNAFVGMRATMMDGSCVESMGMLAAGALLTPNKTVPSGKLWGGNPARFMRDLTEADKETILKRPGEYVGLAHEYKRL